MMYKRALLTLDLARHLIAEAFIVKKDRISITRDEVVAEFKVLVDAWPGVFNFKLYEAEFVDQYGTLATKRLMAMAMTKAEQLFPELVRGTPCRR
jgi:hypothetical protein